MMEKS